MINKFYKIIHSKYNSLFKFIFYLRHLFGIFFVSGFLFLSIPYFLDFKKKEEIFKNYLFKSYGLKLNNYENIKYNSLPIPSLEIKNADLSIEIDKIKMDVAKIVIYPKLLNIYNFKDFKARKIVLIKNKISLSDTDLKILIDYIYNLKKNIKFKNLYIKINGNNLPLITLNKINFSNYGYQKNIITGNLFDKKFKILISESFNKINFKLQKTGLTAEIRFNDIKQKSVLSGVFKSKFFNSNLKFNFEYDYKKFKIYNSYYRSKNLFFNNESIGTYSPFFNLNSILKIEEINTKLLDDININKILSSKDLIKNLNSKNDISFKSKKFSSNLIDEFNLNINLAYGRLVYSKTFLISKNFFKCKGEINLLEQYPILFFDCSILSSDKKNLLNQFSIKYKIKNETFQSNTKGYINILNNKINFQNITMNDYAASKEDLNYFKQLFETIIFDEDFLRIFDYKKIKKFILEIS
jgi:hypothetical protein